MIMTPYFSIPRVRGKRMSYEQLAEGLFAVRDVFAIWLTGGTKINIVLEFLIKNLSDSKLAYIDHSGALSVFDILSRNSTEIYRNSSLVSIHFLIIRGKNDNKQSSERVQSCGRVSKIFHKLNGTCLLKTLLRIYVYNRLA